MDKPVDNEDPIRKRDRLAVEFANKEIAKGYIPPNVNGYAKPFITLGYMEGYDAGRESRSAEVEECKRGHEVCKHANLAWLTELKELKPKLAETEAELKIQDDANDILTRQLAEQAAEIARLRTALGAAKLADCLLNSYAGYPSETTVHGWPLSKWRAISEALAPQAKEQGTEARGGGEKR